MRRILCGAVFAIFFSANCCFSQSEKERISLDFKEATLAEGIEFFRTKTQALNPTKPINFVIDPGLDNERTVSIFLREAPIGIAFAYFVEQAGFDYLVEPHAARVVKAGTGSLSKRKVVSKSISASYPNTLAMREITLPKVEFSEAPLSDVLQYLTMRSEELDPKKQGVNFVVHRLVDQKIPVTLELRNIPVSQVVWYVAKKTMLEVRPESEALFFDPPGTKALADAKRRAAEMAYIRKTYPKAKVPRRGVGYDIGTFPNDPRSPVHPDYVPSNVEDVRTRTNALNNVYKWVNGKWTFVRYGGGELDGNGRRLITPNLENWKTKTAK